MRLNLEKVDIFEKMNETFSEVTKLQDVIYKERAAVGVQVSASAIHILFLILQQATVDTADAETQLKRGELYDELEESLKLTQGELATTCRQVQVLQERLQETVGELSNTKMQMEETTVLKEKIVRLIGRRQLLQALRPFILQESALEELKISTNNMQKEYQVELETYEARILKYENHSVEMNIQDRERFRRLEAEFEQVFQLQKYPL